MCIRDRKNIPFDHKSSLRPTSNKLREILFDWLQFEIKDFECLDLFSGTGALGIEAISRGASKLIFIESNPVPVKWMLYKMKMIENSVRLPLVSLDEKYRDNIRTEMLKLGLL